MIIKIHTLIKGIVWEFIGVVILFIYTWNTVGDMGTAGVIGIGYPIFRALLWYPYERLFKYIKRRKWLKECKQSDIYH